MNSRDDRRCVPICTSSVVLLLRGDEQLVLVRVVAARFLEVDVLARLEREDRHRRVPVIGVAMRDGVDVLVVERATKIVDRFGAPRLRG